MIKNDEPPLCPFPLRLSRVHEVIGPAAYSFGLISAHHAGLPMLWIRKAGLASNLFPQGIAAFLSPDQILLARPADQTDSLAVAEEALKDKALKSVVLESQAPLNLREGRRLQLAAQSGGGMGLCLIRDGMGSNAAETRWICSPLYDPQGDGALEDSTWMRWECIKNKSGTIGAWHVRWDRTAHRLHMVPAPSHRASPAPQER